MADPQKQKINLNVVLPAVTAKGRQRAAEVAGAEFVIEKGHDKIKKKPSNMTEEDVRAEAHRLSSISNPDTREQEIFHMLDSVLGLIGQCQRLAKDHLMLADTLEEARASMTLMQQVTVQSVKRIGDGKEKLN